MPPRARRGLWGLLAGICLLAAAPAWAGDLPWIDYDQALAQGGKSEKPLLLYFRTPWCYQCREMGRKVFSDPEVARVMSQGFVLVKVDLSQRPRLGELFDVHHVPTFIFRNPLGRPLHRRWGYVPRDEFLALLQGILAGEVQADSPGPPGGGEASGR